MVHNQKHTFRQMIVNNNVLVKVSKVRCSKTHIKYQLEIFRNILVLLSILE